MELTRNTVLAVVAAGIVAYVANRGIRTGFEAVTKFGSETERLVNENTGQEIVNNYGEIQKVSTERGIMAGRMVGQTYNLSNSTPYGKISYGPDLSAYTMTMSATTPSFGQNYTGAAVGAN